MGPRITSYILQLTNAHCHVYYATRARAQVEELGLFPTYSLVFDLGDGLYLREETVATMVCVAIFLNLNRAILQSL
jgi:hypothetical protein